MSDNLQSFQKYRNFLNDDHSGNFESFKQLLYGSCGKTHTDGMDCNGLGKDFNRNGFKSSKRKPSCSTAEFKYDNGENENVLGNANRQTCIGSDQANMEFSHFDELDRISSCLIRLLGEAREEHGQLRNRMEHPIETPCTSGKPTRGTRTNFSHVNSNLSDFQPSANFPLSTDSSVGPVYVDKTLPHTSGSVGSGYITSILTEVERSLANHQNVYLDDDLSAIEPSIQDSTSTSESNINNRDGVFLDNDISVSDALQECQSTNSDIFDTAFPTVKERVQSFKQKSLEYRTICTDKERKKKDNHNMVERRRRFHINDRIKDVRTLLPYDTDTKVRQNNGSVLKVSVEYIEKLRKEQERIEQMDEKIIQNELLCKKIITRMQKLEKIMKTKLSNQALSEVLLESKCNAASSDTDTFLDSEDTRPECHKETALTKFDQFNMQISEATESTMNLDDTDPVLSTESIFSCTSLSSGYNEDDLSIMNNALRIKRPGVMADKLRKSLLQQPSQPLNVPEDTGLWEHSNIPKKGDQFDQQVQSAPQCEMFGNWAHISQTDLQSNDMELQPGINMPHGDLFEQQVQSVPSPYEMVGNRAQTCAPELQSNLSELQPSMTLPNDMHNDFFSAINESGAMASRCKTTILDKKQKKKDKHNLVERRRRFNINDGIQELRLLLPFETDRKHKVSILQASVEYIKKLKKDSQRPVQLEEKVKQSELHYKKLLLRIQKLERAEKCKRLKK